MNDCEKENSVNQENNEISDESVSSGKDLIATAFAAVVMVVAFVFCWWYIVPDIIIDYISKKRGK